MSYLLDQKSKHMSAGDRLDESIRNKKSAGDVVGAAIQYAMSDESKRDEEALANDKKYVEERQARAKKSLIESGEDPKKYGY